MSTVRCRVDDRAHIKLILHTARYHWAPVIGLLIGSVNNDDVVITDVLPLAHNPINGPIVNIGLSQANAMYSINQTNKVVDQSVIGIYVCNERREIHPAAQRLANQILSDQSNNRAIILNVDSTRLSATHLAVNHPFEGLLNTGERWVNLNNQSITCTDAAVSKARKLIATNVEQQIVDFEAHIDDVTQDWTNKFVDEPIST